MEPQDDGRGPPGTHADPIEDDDTDDETNAEEPEEAGGGQPIELGDARR